MRKVKPRSQIMVKEKVMPILEVYIRRWENKQQKNKGEKRKAKTMWGSKTQCTIAKQSHSCNCTAQELIKMEG